MIDQTSQSTSGPEQWGAFQKIWTDSFQKMLQLGMTFTPESTPPEFMRQMRASIFQAMAQSWDEFLRSPQFLDGMKQWMESAIAFRKLTNDQLTRMQHDMQSPARSDIDAVLVALRHLEQRIGSRLDAIEAQLEKAAKPSGGHGSTASPPKPQPRKKARS